MKEYRYSLEDLIKLKIYEKPSQFEWNAFDLSLKTKLAYAACPQKSLENSFLSILLRFMFPVLACFAFLFMAINFTSTKHPRMLSVAIDKSATKMFSTMICKMDSSFDYSNKNANIQNSFSAKDSTKYTF